MARYSVIVGNIGTVVSCDSARAACDAYHFWTAESQRPHCRASGEPVTWFSNDLGEPLQEYPGSISSEAGTGLSL